MEKVMKLGAALFEGHISRMRERREFFRAFELGWLEDTHFAAINGWSLMCLIFMAWSF